MYFSEIIVTGCPCHSARGSPAPKLAGRERPDATPAEHRERLELPASRVTVWRAMRRLGLSRKKKSTHASERDRPDVEARRLWPEKLVGDPKDLLFLNETGPTPPCRSRRRSPS